LLLFINLKQNGYEEKKHFKKTLCIVSVLVCIHCYSSVAADPAPYVTGFILGDPVFDTDIRPLNDVDSICAGVSYNIRVEGTNANSMRIQL
jgi:hypothetical protein